MDIVCAFRWHLMTTYFTSPAIALYLNDCLLHRNIFSTQNILNCAHILRSCPFVRVDISLHLLKLCNV
jgi:hypothetical protein